MKLTISLPQVAPGRASNLFGVLGIAGVLVAVGALLDWRWSLLLGSFVAVAVSYVTHLAAEQQKALHAETSSLEARRALHSAGPPRAVGDAA